MKYEIPHNLCPFIIWKTTVQNYETLLDFLVNTQEISVEIMVLSSNQKDSQEKT